MTQILLLLVMLLALGGCGQASEENNAGYQQITAEEAKQMIDEMDDELFELYLQYHFVICERSDMVGTSHHILDVFQKNGK